MERSGIQWEKSSSTIALTCMPNARLCCAIAKRLLPIQILLRPPRKPRNESPPRWCNGAVDLRRRQLTTCRRREVGVLHRHGDGRVPKPLLHAGYMTACEANACRVAAAIASTAQYSSTFDGKGFVAATNSVARGTQLLAVAVRERPGACEPPTQWRSSRWLDAQSRCRRSTTR